MISIESTVRIYWRDQRIRVVPPVARAGANATGAGGAKASSVDYVIVNRDPVKRLWFPDVFVDKVK